MECTCLPSRIVEDDLTSGLSPLGLDSEQCVQVPSDLVYNLHNLNGLSCHNVTLCRELSQAFLSAAPPDDWKISEFVTQTGRGETRSLSAALSQSMQAETEHEMKVKSRGKTTSFNRTSPVTQSLAHNFMIMRSLQITAEQSSAPADSRTAARSFSFFRDICVSLSATQSDCSESCDGKFRTVTGCCNNLVHPQYGEI